MRVRVTVFHERLVGHPSASGGGCSTHAALVGPPLPVYVDEVDRFVCTRFGTLSVPAIVEWCRPTTPAPC